jgi:hypothetical protein
MDQNDAYVLHLMADGFLQDHLYFTIKNLKPFEIKKFHAAR